MAEAWIVLGALALEAAVGYPDALHRRIPHPVTWLGALIGAMERRWNQPERPAPSRRALGVAAVIILIVVAIIAGRTVERAAMNMPLGYFILIAVATLGLAQRSLYLHVSAVAQALDAGDVPAARVAVAHVVGRDVQALNASGVAAAALESLAESFNDGVVAAVFWFVLGGLPGLFAYKAINTADSMIGHLEPRWKDFGWAAARTDDVMNFIPARLAGAFLSLTGKGGWQTMRADASKHASPNAGWPEAAMAGVLGVRLGGTAVYDGVTHERPVFGDGPAPIPADVRRGLYHYVMACAFLWAAVLAWGLLWPR